MNERPQSHVPDAKTAGDRYDPLHAPPSARIRPDYSIPGDVILPQWGPDGTERLRVRTHRHRADWVPLDPQKQRRSEGRAPATIHYRGGFYEVVECNDDGPVAEYVLAPWPEGEVLRRVIPYSRQTVLAEIRTQRDLQRYRTLEYRLRFLYPFVGMLPAEAQSALADRYPIDLYRSMIWSCWAEVLLGVYLLFVGGVLSPLQGLTGGGDPLLPASILGIPTDLWVVASPYFVVEGFIRWQVARLGRLLGFLPFELLWRLLP